MYVIGLDVGYWNLKVAAGVAGGPPLVTVRPAGAAPVDRLGTRINGSGLASEPADPGGCRWRAVGRGGRARALRGLAAAAA